MTVFDIKLKDVRGEFTDTSKSNTSFRIQTFLAEHKESPLVLLYLDKDKGYILNENSRYTELWLNIDNCFALTSLCSVLIFHTNKDWDISSQGSKIIEYTQKFDSYYNAFKKRLSFLNMKFYMCDSFIIDLDKVNDNIDLLRANQYIGNTYIVPKFVSCCKESSLSISIVAFGYVNTIYRKDSLDFRMLKYIKRHDVHMEKKLFYFDKYTLCDTNLEPVYYDIDLTEFQLNGVCVGEALGSYTKVVDVSNWDLTKRGTLHKEFNGALYLEKIIGLDTWDVSHITDFSSLFCSCLKLKDMSDIANWDVSNATSMRRLFFLCDNLKDITALKNWNVSRVTTMEAMFCSCYSLSNLEPLRNWDVSNVTNMQQMFTNCTRITGVEALKNWNTHKVTDMQEMFSGCSRLEDIAGLGNWGTENVRSMHSMFNKTAIISIEPITRWNVCSVMYMNYMFYKCKTLNSVAGISNWHTRDFLSVHSMFGECYKIKGDEELREWWSTLSTVGSADLFET